MAFLDDYEPVADRIERFWQEHPVGSILTELVYHDEKSFIVKASVWRRAHDVIKLGNAALASPLLEALQPHATGYAEEVIGSTNVNRTSALENCETSAIGRALANLGYAVKNRASREEMEKVQAAPRQRSGMKRTPTPEPQESHTNGVSSHLTPEQAIQVANIKKSLLARLDGDKAEASRLWRGTIENFGLNPDEPLPADMIPAIEHSIKALGIKGEE